MDIRQLARPEILALKPYESARGSAPADGILLNANEAPLTLVDDPDWRRLALNRYPLPQPGDLKQRMADLYAVDATQLMVTRGSDEGIDLLLRVFCAAGQHAIIECPPCFGMYRIAAGIQGAERVAVPRLRKHAWQIDPRALCDAIDASETARLVFLTSPNNPTGDLLSRETLVQALDASEGKALVVLDEAYIEFCETPSASDLVAKHPHLVVLRTLSKAWAAAGLRCGSVIADPVVISLLQRVMAPYPLTAMSIDAAMRVTSRHALGRRAEMLELIRSEKQLLVDFLTGAPWVREAWPGEANFVLVHVHDAAALVAYCATHGIRIRDFSKTPRLDDCVRISIGNRQEMAALLQVLDQYGKTT